MNPSILRRLDLVETTFIKPPVSHVVFIQVGMNRQQAIDSYLATNNFENAEEIRKLYLEGKQTKEVQFITFNVAPAVKPIKVTNARS